MKTYSSLMQALNKEDIAMLKIKGRAFDTVFVEQRPAAIAKADEREDWAEDKDLLLVLQRADEWIASREEAVVCLDYRSAADAMLLSGNKYWLKQRKGR